MDIAKPKSAKRSRRIRTATLAVLGIAIVSVLTVALARLKPADPTVDTDPWKGTVERGPMLRQVRGTGTLVPEDIRVIPAATDGQIDRIVVLAGTDVKPDTVILELSNPELQLSLQDAQFKLKAALA